MGNTITRTGGSHQKQKNMDCEMQSADSSFRQIRLKVA